MVETRTGKKVLLLNPPGDKLYIRDYYCSFSSKAKYYWPPQDLIGLSGIVNEGFEVKVLDAIVHKLSPEECFRHILERDYRAVIFSTGTATLSQDFALMEKIKKARPGIKIVASAGILKFFGKEWLEKYSFLDAMILDFAEKDVLSYLRENGPGPLKGMIYRQGEDIIIGEGKLPLLFSLPLPRHELFDFKKYRIPTAKNFPFTVVVASLGCPHRCSFCTAGAFGYRLREVDNVIEELEYLAKLGVKEILFQDPTFTLGTKRVVELCQKMISHNLKFTWSCNADIKTMKEEKIYWMKKAGCHTVSVGIESGSDEMLRKYSKMITIEEIHRGIDLLNKYRIRILGYFIIGLPGETRDSVQATIDLAKRLKMDFASFAIATPDIGTRLRQEAIEKGYIPEGFCDFDSTAFPVLETSLLSKEEIWNLRKRAVRAFYLRPNYLFRKFLKLRNFRDLRLALENAFSLFRQ